MVKRATGDAYCDDQECSCHLQKRLKLSNQKCYDAIRAMREGRDDRECILYEWGAWMDEVYLIPEKNNAARIADQIGIQRLCVKKTEKGWVDNNALYWWIVNHTIPEVDKMRGGNCINTC